MPKYWKKKNPSTFYEDDFSLYGSFSCPLHSGEADLPDRSRLDLIVQQLLREAREKLKGWVTYSTFDHMDVAFKKVSVYLF